MNQTVNNSRLSGVGWNPWLAAIGLLITWQTAVRADDLLKLVAADSAICVQVRNLSSHTAQLESSEFATRVVKMSFFKIWQASDEYKRFQNAQTKFEAAAGTSARKLIDNVFGNDFVIAVRMTVGEGPTGVLITKANTTAALTQSLASWDAFQPQTRTELSYQGITYTKSTAKAVIEGNKAKPVFYVTLDTVLAISETESMIRRVIELHQSPDEEDSLDELAAASSALKRRDKNEVASFYVNPRAFSQFDLLVPENMRDYWRRLQWLSFRLNQFDDELQLDFVVDYDNSEMPDWWKKLVQETAQNRLPLDRVPANALLTVSGHFSSSTIDRVIKQALENGDIPDEIKPARRVIAGLLLGNDLLDDVLPMLGPTWTFYAVPRDAEKSKAFPTDAIVAVALKEPARDSDEKQESRKAGLHNALDTGLNLLCLVHNTKSTKGVSVIRKKIVNGVTIKYADPVAMFQPAYAITNEYLVLATSPEMCAGFLKRAAAGRLLNAKITGTPTKQLEGKVQLIFANTKSIREMLKAHHEWFVWQAKKDSIPESDVQHKIGVLSEFLHLIDGTYISFGVHPSSLRLSLGAIAVSGN